MQFDLTDSITQADGLQTEYGIVRGNGNVVIIKAGAGGSCEGHARKYLRMAQMLHAARGCTVICFSNYSADSFARTDASVIRDALDGMAGERRLYYVGSSNGATQGLLLAPRYFSFERMVLVNMPLMQNFHKIKEALTRLHADVRFVFGEMDPSYSYLPFLRLAAQRETCRARVEIETVSGADHTFTGKQDDFLEVCTRLLLSAMEK